MKDFLSIVGHPSLKGFETLTFESEKPMVMVRAGEQKPLGAPMNTQGILTLLKASLSPEVMASCQWGKEFDAAIVGPEGPITVAVSLRTDKTITVLLQAGSKPARPAPAAGAAPAPVGSKAEVDEASIADEVATLTDSESTALLYAPHPEGGPMLRAALENLGYPVKITANPAAALEVLRYHDYPLFVMNLTGAYAQDPVYEFLVQRLMEERRSQYSVLVGPELETGNTMQAFSLSVHLTVNRNDIAQLAGTMEKAILAWKRFVAPLHDHLKEAGRLQ